MKFSFFKPPLRFATVAKNLKIVFYFKNIQCNLSNNREFHQEYKSAIYKYFLLSLKILIAEYDEILSNRDFFQNAPQVRFL